MITNYEAMLVLSVKGGEEATTALFEKFKKLIEDNGTIEGIDEWGKRRLAYLINDESEGLYSVIKFSCEPSFPAEFDRIAKITEGVLRLMVIKK